MSTKLLKLRTPFTFIIVVDDLLNLLCEAPEMATDLAKLSSLGAGLGIHLWAGTQEAGSKRGTGGEGVEANASAKILYKATSKARSARNGPKVLAHYGVERRPPLRPQLAVEVSELDSLLKRRLDLEQALQKEQTRLSEMAGRPGLAPQVEASFRQVIEALQKALAEIEQAIAKLTKQHEPFQFQLAHLLALPGVGPKVVLPLLVKLFQWHNLTSGKGNAAGLVAYIGLDPQPYESGRSVRKHAGISKMGDNELRRLLYMGALGGVRGNNPLKPFYQRLVGRGKAKKVALVAAARKILVWAWTIFSRQIAWNPDFHQIGA